MKTLIIDDSHICRKSLQRTVAPFGQCDIATDGKEAIQGFQDMIDQNDHYDLVFLDIMMSGIDGRQTLDALRQIEANHKIYGLDRSKIIMTTSLDDHSNILQCFGAECDGYLIKPTTPEKTLELLSTLIPQCIKA